MNDRQKGGGLIIETGSTGIEPKKDSDPRTEGKRIL